MKRWALMITFLASVALILATPIGALGKGGGGGGGGGSNKPIPEETEGNNLSFPVIWAEGVEKALRGTPGEDPVLDGVWWYQWGSYGVDPDVTPASCLPDPDESEYLLNPTNLPLCDDGLDGFVDNVNLVAGTPPADNTLDLAKAFIQKDAGNVWQAGTADWSEDRVNVHWIDWGDNLESIDWYTNSQVRTEVVLFQDLMTPMREYEMRHVDGWGIDEVHGIGATLDDPLEPILGPGDRATVYTHCARLTIQKLLVDREESALDNLVWVPTVGWTGSDADNTLLINEPIFNKPVHEGGDGPGFYSAEINVKGRIIYGYTWNVRSLNDDGAGDYRITFSLDSTCGTATLNTYFDNVTEIIVPLEEEIAAIVAEADAEPGGGAEGFLIPAKFDAEGNLIEGNLTYIDVRILEKGGGGGGRR